jgi:PAS domain S-box-containing protein
MNGEPLGLISVMSRRPMTNAEFVESILKIFAMRAAAELERQRSEEVLRRSEASYRAVFESSVDAIFMHDWDTGAVIDVNGRACEVYGYSYDEMLGIDAAKLCSGVPPYTGEEAVRWVQKAKNGGPVRTEWHRRNRDGSLHWDEVVLRPAIIAGRRRVLAFTREISERKEAEQALRQAQKMEALGHLTGGMAHDINNLLTSIMGYIVLAAEAPGAASDVRLSKYLEQARLSCTRARDLIRQMLTFSRGQRGEPRPVSLPELIGHTVKLFGSSFPSTLEIRTTCEQEVPAVMLDPVQLEQVLLNLCLNARDAMSGVGTIRIGVASVHGAGRQCTACRKSVSGDYVELSVHDNGSGIAPEVVDRMFEPFFTTKDVGKGSGMGLASVHGIVHELNGHIVVDTAPGSGANFRVLLPPLETQHDAVRPAALPAARAWAAPLSGRVLIVDDDQAVAAFMRALLESWGLTAVVAHSAPEALELFRRDAGAHDIVITDQAMPRMTGIELTRELIASRPGLPVILYTGFNDGIPRAEIDSSGLRAVVTKPVDPHELYGLLRTWLPQAATAVSR